MNSPKKILLVDDDPEMRLALMIRLKANHYDVVVALDGVSGVAEARKQMPDLILLDLGSPAGDGFTVIERLRNMEACPASRLLSYRGVTARPIGIGPCRWARERFCRSR